MTSSDETTCHIALPEVKSFDGNIVDGTKGVMKRVLITSKSTS